MRKKILLVTAVVAMAMLAGWNYNRNNNKVKLSALVLENVEALADGETGKTHKLKCGASGIKMCEATCGIHQITLKAWGNGGTAEITCPG